VRVAGPGQWTGDAEHATLRESGAEYREHSDSEDGLAGKCGAEAEEGAEEVEGGEPDAEAEAELSEYEQWETA